MATKLPTDLVHYIADKETAWFEQMVLALLLLDNEFYGKYAKILCPEHNKKRLEDFREDVNLAIFYALETHHEVLGPRAPVMTDTFAHAALTQMSARSGGAIAPDEVPSTLDQLTVIRKIDLSSSKPIVEAGFEYWLTKRRAFLLIQQHTADPHWDPTPMLQDVKQQISAVSGVRGKETFFQYGHGLDNKILDVARVPIPGLSGLTKALGGGLGLGEGYLFIAPQGGGKTILGCQLADCLCEDVNQTGIYITTEQAHHLLEPRIVSNRCGIPYARIMDNFDPRTLNEDEQRRYQEHRARIEGKLFFEDWNSNDRSRTIESDLEDVVKKAEDRIGRAVNFLVFDWIGSALGRMDKDNMDKLRLIYQKAGDKLAAIATDHKMYTIAFSQAMMGAAVNKKRVDASMIAECKSLGQNMTAVIGITTMFLNGEVPSDQDEPIWDPRQFFYISKARMGTGGCVPFFRQFEYQRMADITSRPRVQ